MKKILVAVLALGVVGFASGAMAADEAVGAPVKIYVGGNFGMNMGTDFDLYGGDNTASAEVENDTGVVISASVGVAFRTIPVRAEFEFSYTSNDLDSFAFTDISGLSDLVITGIDADRSSTYYMLYGYYDIETDSPCTPFVTAGLALAYNQLNGDTVTVAGVGEVDLELDRSETVFAWQVGAGVEYTFTENVSMNLQYRYLGHDGIENDDGYGDDWGNNNVTVGVRYTF